MFMFVLLFIFPMSEGEDMWAHALLERHLSLQECLATQERLTPLIEQEISDMPEVGLESACVGEDDFLVYSVRKHGDLDV